MFLIKLMAIILYLPSLLNYQPIKEHVFKDVIIEYGNITRNNDQDGYFKIYDKGTRSLIKEVIYDNRGYDVFRYLAYVGDDTFVIVCDTYITTDIFALPTYKETLLLKYDINGNFLDREFINYKPINFHNHNYYLIIEFKEGYSIYNSNLNIISSIDVTNTYLGIFTYQFQGDAYINGVYTELIQINYPGIYSIKIVDGNYEFSFDVTIEADYKILGNKYSDGYLGEVKIYSFGDLFLNNEEYIQGSSIKTVGNHSLVIDGEFGYVKIVEFTILPDVAYHDGSEYHQFIEYSEFEDSIRIYSNGTAMFLNNDFYNSELIDKPGIYTLSIYGINNFKIEISFSILPNVAGVESNEIYESVDFYIFGDAKLNGIYITGSNRVTEPGEYELILMLGDNEYKTINFTVKAGKEEVNSFEIEGYLKYIFLAITIIGGVLILRKK